MGPCGTCGLQRLGKVAQWGSVEVTDTESGAGRRGARLGRPPLRCGQRGRTSRVPVTTLVKSVRTVRRAKKKGCAPALLHRWQNSSSRFSRLAFAESSPSAMKVRRLVAHRFRPRHHQRFPNQLQFKSSMNSADVHRLPTVMATIEKSISNKLHLTLELHPDLDVPGLQSTPPTRASLRSLGI